MIKLLRALLVLLTFNLSFAVYGQVPPANWKHTISKSSLKVGEEFELVFTTIIPSGYHIYSNDYGDCPPIKAELNFKPNNSFELIGGAIPVGSHKYVDEVFGCEVSEFEGEGKFIQKLKALSPNPVISGVLSYQMCTAEGQCVQFEYKFEVAGLKVSGASIKPTTPVIIEPETSQDDSNSASELDSQLFAKLQALENCCKDENNLPAFAGAVPASEVDYSSYQKRSEADAGKCEEKTFKGAKGEESKESYWLFFIIAFLSGLAALLTPCVFPMIPMTVSYFLKEKNKTKAIRSGLIYGLSIIGIYVIIGTLVAVIAGPAAANFLSTHWLPNIFFFVVFVIFAASFFGAFELVLPSWLVNKADSQADKGGLLGIFFMAFTIVLVSFSCTGPIVGSILVESAGGKFVKPLIGMLGFSLAFAIPFALFAIFPSWLSGLPRSGGWLNSVKVVLGFIELAFGFKFLSVADQTYHWGLLDREIYLAIWIVIFTLMGIYLLGKLKFAHDSETPFLRVPRLFLAIITFTFVVYLIPGMWGAPLKALAGYLPPMSTHDFDLLGTIRNPDGSVMDEDYHPKYSDKLHIPYHIKGFFDYEEGMEYARRLGKPVFLDFTGHGCVNCREMEARVWGEPEVLPLLKEEFIVISLYADDKELKLPESERYFSKTSGDRITMLSKKNLDIQGCYFAENSQPQYILLDNRGEMIAPERAYNLDVAAYADWLHEGLEEYKKRMEAEKEAEE